MFHTYGIDRDRLSVLSGALLLGLALARFFETPVRSFTTSVLGSPLGINLSGTTLMLLIMIGLSITATESLVRSHPLARSKEFERSTIYWIVPTLLTVGLAGWLSASDSLGIWTVGLLISALLLPLALAAEYGTVDPEQRKEALLQWGKTFLIYLVALMLFSLIYDQRARALLSGTAVFIVAFLLAVRFFWFQVGETATASLYALSAGIILGLFTWVINYWPITTTQGGPLIFLLFYVVVGLMQQSIRGRFNRRTVLEYAGLGFLGTLLLVILL